MLVLVIVALTAWMTLALSLAAFMARRGYEHTAWLVLGVLFGPVAAVFVVLERVWTVPRGPQTTSYGHAGVGDLDVLVVADSLDLDAAAAELTWLSARIRRLAIASVVTFDGPREAERLAAEQLRLIARRLGHVDAELVLLFGVSADAVTQYATDGRFDITITSDGLAGRAATSPTLRGEANGVVFLSGDPSLPRGFVGSGVSSARRPLGRNSQTRSVQAG